MVLLAKALYKFEGTQSDDLSFDEDDVITVISKVSCQRLFGGPACGWCVKQFLAKQVPNLTQN